MHERAQGAWFKIAEYWIRNDPTKLAGTKRTDWKEVKSEPRYGNTEGMSRMMPADEVVETQDSVRHDSQSVFDTDSICTNQLSIVWMSFTR